MKAPLAVTSVNKKWMLDLMNIKFEHTIVTTKILE